MATRVVRSAVVDPSGGGDWGAALLAGSGGAMQRLGAGGCGEAPRSNSALRYGRNRWRRVGGSKGGRRRKLSEDDLAMARALLKDPSIPVAQIAKRLDVSRATFYAYFPQARARSLS